MKLSVIACVIACVIALSLSCAAASRNGKDTMKPTFYQGEDTFVNQSEGYSPDAEYSWSLVFNDGWDAAILCIENEVYNGRSLEESVDACR